MRKLEIRGDYKDINAFQGKYESLIAICEREATLVTREKSVVKDRTEAPHLSYFRRTKEYIFPKQEVAVKEDTNKRTEEVNYLNTEEKRSYTFNETLVSARIKIGYKDANYNPEIIVTYEPEHLPERLKKSIQEILIDL